MSTFSCPELPVPEIIAVFSQTGIASIKHEDLANPSADLMCSLFSNFLAYVDPLGDDLDGQIGFSALEVFENPDHHIESIRISNLYRKVKEVLASIRFGGLTLRDMLSPDPKRTIQILSTIANFLFYRDDKLNMLQPIVDQFPAYEEKRMELDEKIARLNKEIADHEVACQMEEPAVQELEAEVKQLRQTIQSYNKQQMSLKAQFKELKDKSDVVKDKISRADFELSENALENSKLLSKIVQSPDKLQRALDEKKTKRAEVKNSERAAMVVAQEKTAILEIFSKAHEKMSKQLSQVQAIQEQVKSAKSVEKEVKALKGKLSDQEVSNMSLEASLMEMQGKAKQAEELIKAIEKQRDARQADDIKNLDAVLTQMEQKLQYLEPRERNAEAMVGKGERLLSEADSAREAARDQQQALQAKLEQIVHAFHNYSSFMDSFLERVDVAVDEEKLGTAVAD